MCLFSLVGLLTSLRLKGELEECLAKIKAMSTQLQYQPFCSPRERGKVVTVSKVPVDVSILLLNDDRRFRRTYRLSSHSPENRYGSQYTHLDI